MNEQLTPEQIALNNVATAIRREFRGTLDEHMELQENLKTLQECVNVAITDSSKKQEKPQA